jgi:uncharacterized membrane protein
MSTNRLEAFSDGVIAILITIMVLELKVPEGEGLHDLEELVPVFLAYVLSFVYLGIYWNNHHHMLQTTERVTGAMLWANLHLLFWLSLFPATTHWIGETHAAPTPTAVYGVVMLGAALAYFVLQTTIVRSQGPDGALARALGADRKGKASPALYLAAVVVAPFVPWLSIAIYVLVALMWLVPDRRVERVLQRQDA